MRNQISEAPAFRYRRMDHKETNRDTEILSIELSPDEMRGEPGRSLVERAEASGATLLGGQIFGSLGGGALPHGVVRLKGIHASGTITGARGFAVRSSSLRAIEHEGTPVGWTFDDGATRFGYFPARLSSPFQGAPESQARAWFGGLEPVLAAGGFSFADVVRTWFYLDRVLDWYGAFNSVRNDFFEARGVYGRIVPASTGVGASNSHGAAICADVLCVQQGGASDGRLREVDSPLQCAALDYRSSFSRAVELAMGESRWLMVSGTASIASDGSTAHRGDAEAQINLTMEVLEALLVSRGLNWQSVWRGVAYFRDPSVQACYDQWLKRKGMERLPLTRAVCEICREDLLFEAELDARG